MKTRVALVGIVVENLESTQRLNTLLHDFGEYVIGRMGVPYRAKGICIISLALDAPETAISALAGKLGMLPGVSVKIVYATK